MSAEKERQRLATEAGLTVTQASGLSGADLHQKVLLAKTSQTLAPGKDGARLMLLNGNKPA